MTLKSIVTSLTIAATATFGITSKAHAGSDAEKIMSLVFFAAIAAALADDEPEKKATTKRAHKPKNQARKHGRRQVHRGIRHKHGRHGAYHFHKLPRRDQQRRQHQRRHAH